MRAFEEKTKVYWYIASAILIKTTHGWYTSHDYSYKEYRRHQETESDPFGF